MISIAKDKVTIPRTTWDKLRENHYYNELIEIMLDSEELADAIKDTDELFDLREYDKERRVKNGNN